MTAVGACLTGGESLLEPRKSYWFPGDWYETAGHHYGKLRSRPIQITIPVRGDVIEKYKREALEAHSLEMERALMLGTRGGGKTVRSTKGLLEYIQGPHPGKIVRLRREAWGKGTWREQILKLYPSGDAPLTKLMERAGPKVNNAERFKWWERVNGQSA